MGIGIQGGIAQEQAQVQIITHTAVDTVKGIDHTAAGNGNAAQAHGKHIHHQHAGQVEKIKPQCTPDIFHGTPQGIIADEGNSHQEQVGATAAIGQRERNQTPNLALQNQLAVEAKNIIQHHAAGGHANQIYQRTAQRNIQHQIGNALIPVLKTETFEFVTKIFQGYSTPIS